MADSDERRELQELEELERLEAKDKASRRRTPSEMAKEEPSGWQTAGRYAGLFGRGVAQGVIETAKMFIPPVLSPTIPGSSQERFRQKLEQAPGMALSAIGLPEPKNIWEKVVTGAGELVPSAYLGGKTLGAKTTSGMQTLAQDLMASALKAPIKSWRTGETAKAIDVLLSKGINVSKGGVGKLRNMIDTLNAQIKSEIASSPAVVDKTRAGQFMSDLIDKFKMQVNPGADVGAIQKAWDEFKMHPFWDAQGQMPVQLAQEIKQGTYKQLRDKYGQLGTADVEAQKALARGMKEEIARGVPSVVPLNKEESQLMAALNVTERRVLMSMNRNPAGLAWLTHSPSHFAAFVADKSDIFKSLLARMINRISSGTGKAVGAVEGMSLYEMGKKSQEMQQEK